MGEAFITRRGGSGDTYYLDIYVTASTGTPDLSGIAVTATYSGSSYGGTTDSNGRCQIQVSKNVTYTISCAKTFFVFSPTSQSATTTSVVTDVFFTCYKSPTYIGTATNTQISGRTITLTPTTGTAITLTTGSTGVTPETALTLGMSYTEVCDYPDGYGVSPESATISSAVAGTQYTQSFTILSKPTRTVSVTDSSGGTGNVGLTVTFTASDDTVTGVTDSSGNTTVTLMAGRTYTVSVAVGGTYLSVSTQSVTPSAGTTGTISFSIALKPVITVTTSDESGSGFESGRIISYTDGTNTYTGASNSSGIATITCSTLGTFTASMTNIPTDGDVSFTPASVTVEGNGTYSVACVISFGFIYGVKITIGESDPATAVTYTDNCAGWAPMSFSGTTFSVGSWADAKIWDYIDPVAFDGTTDTLLNKTNLAQDVNGNTVSTTTDKFTRIKKMWLDIHNDGTYIYVRISSRQADSNFSDWSFSYNGTVQECMRIGCYLAYNTSSRTYSRTSVTPSENVSLTNVITYAQARGTGYDLFRYNQLILIQALYVIMFRNLDSQSKLGQGYTGGSAVVGTGANNALVNQYGMYGSTSSGKVHVSFLWIEDFYGNLRQWIGGMGSTSTKQLAVSDKSASSISGWETAETGVISDISGYLTQVVGTAKTGFCPKKAGGSSSTYYCDYGYSRSSNFPCFGGRYSDGSYAGTFYLDVTYPATYASANVGSRLSHSGGL